MTGVAGGTDFCEPDVLLAFTDRAEAIAESIDRLVTRLDEARVDSGAFGRMPFIGEKIYTAYDDHVRDTKQGITEAQSAVLGAGAAVAQCAAAWLQAEAATLEAMTTVGETE